jgi:hypothetical protein
MEYECKIAAPASPWLNSLVEIRMRRIEETSFPISGNLGEPVFRQPGSVAAHEDGMYE